ncbi:MAG: hypothetical protein ACE5JI_11945 [Acidobacteriota bacterium]
MSGLARWVAPLLALLLAPPALAQPRGGIVRGRVENGTTGGPGKAEKVTLFKLGSGMEPVATLGTVSGTFILDNIELEGETPYLLQVTSGGVNYNQPVRFGRGYEAEASFTVYDVTLDWKDLEIKTARFLFRRDHDRLRVDKLYVIENRTDPKKTLYDPEGTFRFFIPQDVVEMRSVSASSGSGMPVPQAASPLPGGAGYFTRTAFKPGMTDIAISYDVDYSSGRYRLDEKAYHPLTELMALIAPADIELSGGDWENLGPAPDGRFTVVRRMNVATGSPIQLTLSGGSDHAAELVSSSESEERGGRVTRLPDPTRPQKWILVILMGAALAYGLLSSLVEPPRAKTAFTEREARQALARLKSRHAAGDISTKRYRREKRALEARIEREARRSKH